MLKIGKQVIALTLCTMTTGCFLPPVVGLVAQPVTYFLKSDDDTPAAKGPISVSELLAKARGDEPRAGSAGNDATPESRAIEAAMESSGAVEPGPRGISVDALLAQARASETWDGRSPTSGNAPTAVDGNLADLARDGSAVLSLQLSINRAFPGDGHLQVTLGIDSAHDHLATLSRRVKAVGQMCRRLENRCDESRTLFNSQVRPGWVRIKEIQGDPRA